MNFAMARSSITLSDRQGIIDIPYRYLLTSVSSWVYFRLAAQSQVSYSTKKMSLVQISPVSLKIERPKAIFNPNTSWIISVVPILKCETYLLASAFEGER